jgi:hypothetical protein
VLTHPLMLTPCDEIVTDWQFREQQNSVETAPAG